MASTGPRRRRGSQSRSPKRAKGDEAEQGRSPTVVQGQTHRRKSASRDSEGRYVRVASVFTPRLGKGGYPAFAIHLPRCNAPATTEHTVEIDGKSVSFLRFSAMTSAPGVGLAPRTSTGGSDVEMSDRVSSGLDGLLSLRSATSELLQAEEN